jgi:hypothetical protein
MRKKLVIGVIGLLLVAAGIYFATDFTKAAPALTIINTSFPSCETRTYTITQKHLSVTWRDRPLAHTTVSPALLKAISDAALVSLDSVYDDPRATDGFELEFRFGGLGHDRVVTVRNRYVPDLYRILEECNRLLPTSARSTEKEHFVWRNEQLQDLIKDYRAKRELPEELRGRVIAELESQLVSIEN